MLHQSRQLMADPGNGDPWQCPRELPDLRGVGRVSIDTETCDRGLQANRGSAWPWGDGWICGISLAWCEDGELHSRYISLRHPDSENYAREDVIRWLNDTITAGIKFITLNGPYDWGWIGADLGITVPPPEQIEEVSAAAALVDENLLKYSLDALCAHYDLPGKDTAPLREAIKAAKLHNSRKGYDPRAYIWQLPASIVAPYAECDAILTLRLFTEKLLPILECENTHGAYRLDCRLVPVVIAMRKPGIRIDEAAAMRARDLLLGKRDAALAKISELVGAPVGLKEIRSSDWKAAQHDARGIAYPRTETGKPSFKGGGNGWMTKHSDVLPRLIAEVNKYHKAGHDFIEGHILDHLVNGRIYPEIHPFRAEAGGTRSSRFSYSKPPLQQLPARDDEISQLVRGCCLSDEGEVWADVDVSQQEFRILVDHGEKRALPGARELGDAYRDDPETDIHATVAELIEQVRKVAKNANFGKIYGMGIPAFAAMIGKSEPEAKAIIAKYDAKLPFAKRLAKICQQNAERVGYILMSDGTRRHFNLYEAVGLKWTKKNGPCSFEEARLRAADPTHPWHGRPLRRAGGYKALNSLIQGDAARQTKAWMCEVYYTLGIVPILQLHDSLSLSVTRFEQAEAVARLGCDAVKLSVPIRVDMAFGNSWGEASQDEPPTWAKLTGDTTPGHDVSYVITPAGASATRPAPQVPPVFAAEAHRPIAPAPEPAPAATVSPEPAATPAAHLNGTHTSQRPAQSSLAFPAFNVSQVTTIDLADLINQHVPKNRKICCPFHAETKPSLHIYPDHYYCFGCHAYGDHIDWLVLVEKLDHSAARERLANWTGPVLSQSAATGPTLADIAQAEKDLAYTLRWWDAAKPIKGTLAERYLAETRGIDLDALPDNLDDVLRFHKHCVFGTGVHHPCLIALMRDAGGDAPTGIQRIALTPEAQKIDRMMLGKAGVVKLWPAAKQLVLGEGLETVLAAATRLPYHDEPLVPAWAALSDGGVKKFPLIDGVERLIVLADNDANNAGQIAAETCKRRWLEAGRRVALLMPDPRPNEPKTDFNDIILSDREAAA